MTRTAAREIAIQLVFAGAATNESAEEILRRFFDEEHYASLSSEDELYLDAPDEKQLEYISRLLTLIDAHRDEIDAQIRRHARGWKIERISKTALAVLRCALCEILYMDDIPNAAAINEAIELAKGYDEPDTVSFINGVLGGFMRGGQDEPSKNE